MPWTEATREQYRRDELRYASDLTDAEWAVVEPYMPAPARLGRPRTTALRAVMDAIQYMAATGCQWRQLPKDFPPYSTVQGYFYAWSRSGRLETINHELVLATRERAGRDASPSAGIIDSEVKARTLAVSTEYWDENAWTPSGSVKEASLFKMNSGSR